MFPEHRYCSAMEGPAAPESQLNIQFVLRWQFLGAEKRRTLYYLPGATSKEARRQEGSLDSAKQSKDMRLKRPNL